MSSEATYWCGNAEIVPTKQQEQAYQALQKAAEKMGLNNYKTQIAAHLKSGRSKKTFRFCVTAEQQVVIETMSQVLSGETTPEDAMGLLWQYDVLHQRLTD